MSYKLMYNALAQWLWCHRLRFAISDMRFGIHIVWSVSGHVLIVIWILKSRMNSVSSFDNLLA